MNQSELIERVARASELSHAAADRAVKATVNLDSLIAEEPVRVSGLGSFDVAERPAREGAESAKRSDRQNPSQQSSALPCRHGRQGSCQFTGRRSSHEVGTAREFRSAE